MKVSTKSTIYHVFHQTHFMCRGELIPGLQLAQTKTMQKKKKDLFLDERSDLKFILRGGLSQVQRFDKYTRNSGPIPLLVF